MAFRAAKKASDTSRSASNHSHGCDLCFFMARRPHPRMWNDPKMVIQPHPRMVSEMVDDLTDLEFQLADVIMASGSHPWMGSQALDA